MTRVEKSHFWKIQMFRLSSKSTLISAYFKKSLHRTPRELKKAFTFEIKLCVFGAGYLRKCSNTYSLNKLRAPTASV